MQMRLNTSEYIIGWQITENKLKELQNVSKNIVT